MDLIEHIKQVLNELDIPSHSFVYDERLIANRHINEIGRDMELPACVLLRSPNFVMVNSYGNMVERRDFLLSFLDKAYSDMTPVEHEDVINRMTELAMRFYRHMIDSKHAIIISRGIKELNLQKIWNGWDLKCDGVSIYITLQQQKGIPLCKIV